jgi:Ulp1 family protease
MSTTDRVVLSYGDTVIRESDLALLNPSQWLNDTLIHFYYE